MTYDGHVVIDADWHIRQYWDLDLTYKDNMDPEYRDEYERFSNASKARQKGPGDSGFSSLLWPRQPNHPMGVYDLYLADEGRRSGARVFDERQLSNRGAEIDPACHWDPAIRLRDMQTAGIDKSVIFP